MHDDFLALLPDPDAPPMQNAYRLARIAQSLNSRRFANELVRLQRRFPRVLTFEQERAFGIAVGDDTDVVLAFRGSDENREWMAALTFGQIPWQLGRVHEGFARTLEPVWMQLMAALFDTGALEKRLWITGHSLGGALAILTAFRLQLEGAEPHQLITFGAPRALDTVAAKAFAIPHLRVVNSEDAAPEFQWPALLDSYEHCGDLVHLLPSGAIAEPRHDPALARRLDRADGIGAPLPRSGPLHDHYIAAYIEKLERHARGNVPV